MVRGSDNVFQPVLGVVRLMVLALSLVPFLVINRLGVLNLTTIIEPIKRETVAA